MNCARCGNNGITNVLRVPKNSACTRPADNLTTLNHPQHTHNNHKIIIHKTQHTQHALLLVTATRNGRHTTKSSVASARISCAPNTIGRIELLWGRVVALYMSTCAHMLCVFATIVSVCATQQLLCVECVGAARRAPQMGRRHAPRRARASIERPSDARGLGRS